MPIELKIPEVGESVSEVQIAQWLKAEGDVVQPGEPVVVVDSEKTTFELPAPEGGTLGKILHQAGATVAVGDVIGHLEPGSPQNPQTTRPSPEKTAPVPEAQASSRAKKGSQDVPSGKPIVPAGSGTRSDAKSQPDVQRTKEEAPTPESAPQTVAEQSEKKETRPRPGQAEPVQAARAEPDEDRSRPAESVREPESRIEKRPSHDDHVDGAAEGEVEVVPMSMLRRTVARRLVEAKQQMAMLTTFNEVDMSAVQQLRRDHQAAFQQRHQVKLGLLSFFVKAAIDALKQFPQLNAEVRGHDIVFHNYFNLGIAIATGRGLVVPVLRRAESMSFASVEKAIGEFATRAQEGKLKPEELEKATFTITNGGVFGSLLSTPIINPPQSGILGMHTIQERPVAVQGQIVIRPMMYLALSYDHRIVDGREAVLFLRRIKETVESPARLLLEA